MNNNKKNFFFATFIFLYILNFMIYIYAFLKVLKQELL